MYWPNGTIRAWFLVCLNPGRQLRLVLWRFDVGTRMDAALNADLCYYGAEKGQTAWSFSNAGHLVDATIAVSGRQADGIEALVTRYLG